MQDKNLVIFVDDEGELEVLYKLKLKHEIKNNLFTFKFFDSASGCMQYLEDPTTHENIILFSDINMPEIDGLQLLEHISSNHKDITTIMISAYDLEDYILRSEQLGAKGFIKKPVNFPELKERIYDIFSLEKN